MTIIKNIDDRAEKNTNFRKVLTTGEYVQVVLMSIPPGGEIGEEVHPDTDQVLYCEEGEGKVVLNGESSSFVEGDLVLVRAGVRHNFINSGDEDLKIITTYSPPHHPDGTIHISREEAEREENK